MKRLLLFLILALSAHGQILSGIIGSGSVVPAGGTASIVQTVAGLNCFGGTTCTQTITPAAGAPLIAFVNWGSVVGDGTRTLSSVSGCGATWSLIAATAASNGPGLNYTGAMGGEIALGTGATGVACTVTATFSGNVTFNDVALAEAACSSGTLTLDQANKGTGSSGAPTTTSITTGAANTIAFASFVVDNGGVNDIAKGAGWDSLFQNFNGGAAAVGGEQKVVAGSGTLLAGAFTVSTGVWVDSIASFKCQ